MKLSNPKMSLLMVKVSPMYLVPQGKVDGPHNGNLKPQTGALSPVIVAMPTNAPPTYIPDVAHRQSRHKLAASPAAHSQCANVPCPRRECGVPTARRCHPAPTHCQRRHSPRLGTPTPLTHPQSKFGQHVNITPACMSLAAILEAQLPRPELSPQPTQ